MAPNAVEALVTENTKLTQRGESVFRLERALGPNTIGVYYIDYSLAFKEAEFNIERYQEKLLADDYYSIPGPRQWNFYLVFVAGAAEISRLPLRLIDTIRHNDIFARKYIVEEDELRNIIQPTHDSGPSFGKLTESLSKTWVDILCSGNLDELTDLDVSVNEVVRRFISGESSKYDAANTAIPTVAESLGEPVQFRIDRVLLERYRDFPTVRDFDFGTANLIVGPNGTGKTSLLEAIELWCCGRIRRNRDEAERENWRVGSSDSDSRSVSYSDSLTPGRLRTRQLLWYGTKQHKPDVEEGFWRYNFFDTDAAVEMSREQSALDISNWLSSLVLGEYTTELEKRINRALTLFNNERKENDNSLQSLTVRSRDAQKTLETLTNNTKELSALSLVLEETLRTGNWTTCDIGTDLGKSSRLGTNLQFADEFLTQLLQNTKWLQSDDLAKIWAQLQSLIETEGTINGAKADTARSQLDIQNLSKESERIEALLPAAERLNTYSLRGITNKLLELQRVHREANARIAILDQSLDMVPSQGWSSGFSRFKGTVSQCYKSLVDRRGVLADDSKKLTSSIEEALKSLGALQQVISQIRASGVQLLKLDRERQDCPLCGHHYERGELADHIEGEVAAKKTGGNAVLEEAMSKLTAVNSSISELQAEIDAVDRALRILGLSAEREGKSIDRYTYVDLQRILSELAKERSELSQSKSHSERELKTIELQGYSIEEYQGLVQLLKDYYESQKLTFPESAATRLADALKFTVEKLADATRRKAAAENTLRLELATLVSGIPPDNMESTYYQRLGQAKVFVEKKSTLLSMFSALKRTVPEMLGVVESTRRAYLDFRSKLTESAKGSSLVDQAQRIVSESQVALDRSIAKKSIVDAALSTLDRIASGSSKDIYLKDFYSANWKGIQNQFQRIHIPNEFREIGVDTSISQAELILTRKNGKTANINEISTGQRTALALSVFMTLNANLTQGPQFILFDDPVAHVDDLNVLSFLDYLRELVLDGSRQVFFATADRKIGALCSKKFECLGGSFRRFELLRSD